MQRRFTSFPLSDTSEDLSPFLRWATARYQHVTFLSSSNHTLDPWSEYDAILATGIDRQICPDHNQDAFQALKEFADRHQDWIFGFLSYDLKNQLENLTSNNTDYIKMPLMHFYVPEIVFLFKGATLQVGVLNNKTYSSSAEEVIREISRFDAGIKVPTRVESIKHRVSRKEYLETVNRIKNHIQKGDIYEANFCIEFYGEHAQIDPTECFLSLNKTNPSPYACFYRLEDKYLLSSSPERFLAKRDNTLITQPIKGTIKRGQNAEEDQKLKEQLFRNPKERSENVMIVDLVRNDLSRTAENGSVKVTELCGIYTYPHVHQMISTVTCLLRKDIHFVDAIKNAFPMGSMTGAPKIRAMEIMEACETTRRGLYSGAVGYITPTRNFDFNVIIRSILYNQRDNFVNFMAGSAITIGSEPESEYSECLLKATSMAQTLHSQL